MRDCFLTACAVAVCLISGAPSQAHPIVRASFSPPGPIVPLSNAQPTTGAAASLVLFGGGQASLKWYGKGAVSQDIPLCVSTPNGRYRLTISSAGAGLTDGATKIPYTIDFKDAAGSEQTATTEHFSSVGFDGAAPAMANCLLGPNATVTIVLDERHLVSGVAGNYADSLQFAVAPR
jgi:hypothetical protein